MPVYRNCAVVQSGSLFTVTGKCRGRPTVVTNPFVFEIKRLAPRMDTPRCRWAEHWASHGSHFVCHERPDTPTGMRTCTIVRAETTAQSQRASVGSAGVTGGQHRIVAVPGCSWTLDSVAIHLLAVTQKRAAARTASVTNNTCLHTSSLLRSRTPETWQHNRRRPVK